MINYLALLGIIVSRPRTVVTKGGTQFVEWTVYNERDYYAQGGTKKRRSRIEMQSFVPQVQKFIGRREIGDSALFMGSVISIETTSSNEPKRILKVNIEYADLVLTAKDNSIVKHFHNHSGSQELQRIRAQALKEAGLPLE